jgi:S1-C subfamily serine protease
VAGAEFTELDPAMKPYFKTDRGILVLRVTPATPAARAGLQAGDVVIKANDQPVDNVREFRRLIAQPQKIRLEILRRGDSRTLELERRSGSNE